MKKLLLMFGLVGLSISYTHASVVSIESGGFGYFKGSSNKANVKICYSSKENNRGQQSITKTKTYLRDSSINTTKVVKTGSASGVLYNLITPVRNKNKDRVENAAVLRDSLLTNKLDDCMVYGLPKGAPTQEVYVVYDSCSDGEKSLQDSETQKFLNYVDSYCD
jgi:hypothetical protein